MDDVAGSIRPADPTWGGGKAEGGAHWRVGFISPSRRCRVTIADRAQAQGHSRTTCRTEIGA